MLNPPRIAILNVYAPNNRAAKYVKQKLKEKKLKNPQFQLETLQPLSQQLTELEGKSARKQKDSKIPSINIIY